MTETIDGRAVVVAEHVSPPTLFGTTDPAAIIKGASERATALARVIHEKHLATNIQGREHVRVEGWTLLGTLLGVFPVTVWTKPTEHGWEARVEARTLSGAVVGAAEAECGHDEPIWRNRASHMLRSMAQTRATSKALRMPLGFVMTLAGYDPTPAEEMIEGESRELPLKSSGRDIDDLVGKNQSQNVVPNTGRIERAPIHSVAIDPSISSSHLDANGGGSTGSVSSQVARTGRGHSPENMEALPHQVDTDAQLRESPNSTDRDAELLRNTGDSVLDLENGLPATGSAIAPTGLPGDEHLPAVGTRASSQHTPIVHPSTTRKPVATGPSDPAGDGQRQYIERLLSDVGMDFEALQAEVEGLPAWADLKVGDVPAAVNKLLELKKGVPA